MHARVTDILVDQGWKHSFFFIVEQVPGIMTRQSTDSGDAGSSLWDEWVQELQARAPMWRVFPWILNTRAWLPQNRERVYTVGLHASLGCTNIMAPPVPPKSVRLTEILHPGLPCVWEHGLTPQQCENLAIAKVQAQGYPGCLASVSLDRNPSLRWSTGFGAHGIINALRTSNDLIWLLQYDASSGKFVFSRCLHPMERCSLQGFRAEMLAGMSKTGVLRATGNAMSVPVIAAVFKRCMEVLSVSLGTALRSPLELDSETQRQINFMREHIALLEAEEVVWHRMIRDRS